MIASMNRALASAALPEIRLETIFERWWPDLERHLAAIGKVSGSESRGTRTDRELLEEILSIVRQRQSMSASETVSDLVAELRDTVGERARRPVGRTAMDRSTVTLDTRPLLGSDGERVQIPYPAFGTVSDFLDDLYRHVADAVPPLTFGVNWLLRDAATGALLTNMGRGWAKTHLNETVDNRPIAEIGIRPGMVLEAIPAELQRS